MFFAREFTRIDASDGSLFLTADFADCADEDSPSRNGGILEQWNDGVDSKEAHFPVFLYSIPLICVDQRNLRAKNSCAYVLSYSSRATFVFLQKRCRFPSVI